MSVRKKSQAEELQSIKDDWRAEGREWPVPVRMIVRWAIDTKRIPESRQTVEDYWSVKMSAALREEIHTDPQGRRVRMNHCYRDVTGSPSGVKKQQYLWCDIVSASPEQIEASLEHRMSHMVHEGVKMQTDADSYSENNKYGVQLRLDFDLRERIAEAMLDDEYDPGVDRPDV